MRLLRLALLPVLAACAGLAPPADAADPAAASPAVSTAWLQGAWGDAAGGAGCQRPWFRFEPARATLQSQADGTPVTFTFDAVRYAAPDGQTVQVDFGRAHGLAWTLSGSTAAFVRVDARQARLLRTRPSGKDASVLLTRCG